VLVQKNYSKCMTNLQDSIALLGFININIMICIYIYIYLSGNIVDLDELKN